MASAIPNTLSTRTLEILDPALLPTFVVPSKRINEGSDVSQFLTSLAYRDIGTFILQLNNAIVPRKQDGSPLPRLYPLTSIPSYTSSIQALQKLLTETKKLIDEAPPDTGPRRFGNVSFRKWYSLLEGQLDGLLTEGLLGETLGIGNGEARKEVASYFLGGFGSPQRLDFGTGHELSFIAFLGCLWKLGFFKVEGTDSDIERQIVLQVIEP